MNTFKDYEKCSSYIVKYPQCNATTNLFGGQLLSWLDEATAICASTHMASDKVVTAKFGGINFEVPTERGSVVTIWAKVTKEGKSSLGLHAVATKRSMGGQEEVQIAETDLVFVALNDEGRPEVWRPERFE